MRIRIRYTFGRLAEMDLDCPMSSPEESIRLEVGCGHDLSFGVPMATLDGALSPAEVWEYRLASHLPDQPEVPCYRFSRVLLGR